MSNADTVNAVITNISAILVTLGYPVEDTSASPTLSSPFSQIHYNGESFDNEYGQRPEYNDIKLMIRVQFQKTTPAISRPLQVAVTHKLREGITVDTVNVGALLTSKLVSFVQHQGDDVIPDDTVSIINYNLIIQYREL